MLSDSVDCFFYCSALLVLVFVGHLFSLLFVFSSLLSFSHVGQPFRVFYRLTFFTETVLLLLFLFCIILRMLHMACLFLFGYYVNLICVQQHINFAKVNKHSARTGKTMRALRHVKGVRVFSFPDDVWKVRKKRKRK